MIKDMKIMEAENNKISYRLVRSARKTIAIHIKPDGEVVVRAPLRCSQSAVEQLIREKQTWILKHLDQLKMRKTMQAEAVSRGRIRPLPQNDGELQEYLRQARTVFAGRTEHYARLMQVSYHQITIRDQKTRWGSCSSKGNLNFNWRLVMAPEQVLDYVVVHELAHRREMNHSPRFWQLVAEFMPDYQVCRTWLREYGACLYQ
ncbi:MAG: M48 family metallopeptidase [Lachnospiraceae bacterium]